MRHGRSAGPFVCNVAVTGRPEHFPVNRMSPMYADLEQLVAAMAHWLEAAHTHDRTALDEARRRLSEFMAHQETPDTDPAPRYSPPPSGV